MRTRSKLKYHCAPVELLGSTTCANAAVVCTQPRPPAHRTVCPPVSPARESHMHGETMGWRNAHITEFASVLFPRFRTTRPSPLCFSTPSAAIPALNARDPRTCNDAPHLRVLFRTLVVTCMAFRTKRSFHNGHVCAALPRARWTRALSSTPARGGARLSRARPARKQKAISCSFRPVLARVYSLMTR